MCIVVQRLRLICLGCHLLDGVVGVSNRSCPDLRARERDIRAADNVVDAQAADLTAGEADGCIAFQAAGEVACRIQIVNLAAGDGDVCAGGNLVLDRAAVQTGDFAAADFNIMRAGIGDAACRTRALLTRAARDDVELAALYGNVRIKRCIHRILGALIAADDINALGAGTGVDRAHAFAEGDVIVERVFKLNRDVLEGRVALHDIAECLGKDQLCARRAVVGRRILCRDDEGCIGMLDFVNGFRHFVRIGDDNGTAALACQVAGARESLDRRTGSSAVCGVIAGLRIDIEILYIIRCRNAGKHRRRNKQQAYRRQHGQQPETEFFGHFLHNPILLSAPFLLYFHFNIRTKPPQRKDFHEIRKFFATPVFMRASGRRQPSRPRRFSAGIRAASSRFPLQSGD